MSQVPNRLLHVRALGRSGDVEALIAELSNPLEHEKLVIRAVAASELSRLRARQAVAPLIEMLESDPNEYARVFAARALGEIGPLDKVAGPLRDALRDPSPNVRTSVAVSLGELGDEGAIEALIDRVQDDEWPVRRAAAEALVRIGDPRAAEPLRVASSRERSFYRRGHLRRASRRLRHNSRRPRA